MADLYEVLKVQGERGRMGKLKKLRPGDKKTKDEPAALRKVPTRTQPHRAAASSLATAGESLAPYIWPSIRHNNRLLIRMPAHGFANNFESY